MYNIHFAGTENVYYNDEGCQTLMNDNAWYNIKPDDYDTHMSHPNVGQTQMLNRIIKEQFDLIPANKQFDSCVAILGITNGNGLEHVMPHDIGRVIGIDISQAFLDECKIRYSNLTNKLSLYKLDLTKDITGAVNILSPCNLIISNLLIEHIHLNNFSKIIAGLPKHGQIISCVIQVNPDGSIASASGVEHVFNDIVAQVEEEDEKALDLSMKSCGYSPTGKTIYDLPNGKQFIRLDYAAV